MVQYFARITQGGAAGEEYIIDDPAQTVGDAPGFVLWEKSGGDRDCSMWGYQISAIMGDAPKPQRSTPLCGKGTAPRFKGTSGTSKLLPLKSVDTPDDRFVGKGVGLPDWATKYPAGWTGTLGGGSDAYAQNEIFHPDFLGLIAVNKGGDPALGSRVFDLNDGGGIDTKRFRELQSMIAVLDLGAGACGIGGTALALQLGPGGRTEGGRPGFMTMYDGDMCQIGFGSKTGGGPLLINSRSTGCQGSHLLGKDADGQEIRPVHLSTGALILGHGGDGPMVYWPDAWQAVQPDPPHWVRTRIRFNTEWNHVVCGTQLGLGMWDVQTPIVFPIPERPPWIPDPDPPRMPPPEEKPPRGPRKPKGPTGRPRTGDPKPPTGIAAGGAAGLGAGLAGGVAIGGAAGVGDGLTVASGVLIGAGQTLGEGAETIETRPAPDPNVGYMPGGHVPTWAQSGQYVGAYPTASQCVMGPGFGFKGFATNPDEQNITGATVPPREDIAALMGAEFAALMDQYSCAPYTGQMTGYAVGTGGWGGFGIAEEFVNGGFSAATGGFVVHPPHAELPAILAGDYDPCAADPKTAPTTTNMVFPGGLAAMFFGQPAIDTPTGIKNGVALQQTCDGLSIGVVGADGSLTGDGLVIQTDGEAAFTGTQITLNGVPITGGSFDPDTIGVIQIDPSPGGSPKDFEVLVDCLTQNVIVE